jgi:UDP-N-acetylmuramoyl-tripeptide--D-alanyl-D-alanine ligase
MNLDTAARVLEATRHGRDVIFNAVASDSRRLQGGELFVALQGPRFDGHAFLADAAEAGAVAAMLHREVDTPLPYVLVSDTRRGMGELAAWWRNRFQIPLIAVTGSNGKTTVKNMIAAILAQTGAGLATEGNLNNDIGVPLTLLRLRDGDRYAVIEMGMNHPGEIDYLTHLARPTIALITNAAAAHLEGLGSVEAVARAKGEIFGGLAENGVAIVNADDVHAPLWCALAGAHRVVRFGLQQAAEFTAEFTAGAGGTRVTMATPRGQIEVMLQLLGRHNVANALAAAAAAVEAGAEPRHVEMGLQTLKAAAGRLELKPGINGAQVIDDTYNANPASVAAGLDVLRGFSGETVLVLGDMGELGEAAPDIHRRVGELARRLGIRRLYTLGTLTRETQAGFGSGEHFEDHQHLVETLERVMHPEMTVLIKGSRASRMERVVSAVCDPYRAEETG